MLSVIVASSNKNKLCEIKDIFKNSDVTILSASDFGVNELPEETGNSFYENAYIKAKGLYDIISKNYADKFNDRFVVIADDSGLCVDALNGAPGIYSARYASYTDKKNNSEDTDNVKKLLDDMEKISNRKAAFKCCMVAVTDKGYILSSDGELKGMITKKPEGNNGFGYDPILYLDEYDSTVAQLAKEIKNTISHRSKAISKLSILLKDYYQIN